MLPWNMQTQKRRSLSTGRPRARSAPGGQRSNNSRRKSDTKSTEKLKKKPSSTQVRRSRSVPGERRTEVQMYLRVIERKRRQLEREERDRKLQKRLREREWKLREEKKLSETAAKKRPSRRYRTGGPSYISPRKSRRDDVTSCKTHVESIPSLKVVVRSRKLRCANNCSK